VFSCICKKLDSFFSHAMKNVHYPWLPYKVHLSFSDFLFLEILDKRRSFSYDDQIDHMLVEPSTYKLWHSL
jgi:hypothetical protein